MSHAITLPVGSPRKTGISWKRAGVRMFSGGIKPRAALAACALAAVAGAAGCSSSGGSGGGAAGGGPGTSTPSWAVALGSGVTIVAPGPAAAGNGSPEGVMAGLGTDFTSGNYTDACKYYEPSAQSQCTSAMSSVTPAEAAAALPTYKNFGLGYTAIKGDEALVGYTGTYCDQQNTPACITNTDPAAIFSSGHSFNSLWTQTGSSSGGSYSLAHITKVNGSWYFQLSS